MRVFLFLHSLFVIIETKRKKPSDNPLKMGPRTNIANNPDMYDNAIPIDFLNMGVSGVFDPSLGQKQPFDGVAMYLMHERKTDEDLRALLNQLAASSRRRHERPTVQGDDSESLRAPLLFNFDQILALNMAKPKIYKEKLARSQLLPKNGTRPDENNTGPERPQNLEDVVPSDFDMMKTGVNEDVIRWTSCDDFAKKARFHPRDVAGVDWVPFYMWSMQSYPIPEEFKFSYPTVKLVEEYKQQYGPKINKNIDWKAPMLLLRNWLEMLLVAGDRRGLFYGIPKSEIPDDIRNSTTWYPHATIRMKMVDQYLAMMFCEEHLAMMLAVVGEEPDPSESAAEAAKLGFRGIGAPVTKHGQAAPTQDDRIEDFGDRSHLDRHSAVVKSFYTP